MKEIFEQYQAAHMERSKLENDMRTLSGAWEHDEDDNPVHPIAVRKAARERIAELVALQNRLMLDIEAMPAGEEKSRLVRTYLSS